MTAAALTALILIAIATVLLLCQTIDRVTAWNERRRARATAYRAKLREASCPCYTPLAPPLEAGGRWTCQQCGRAHRRSWSPA